VSFQGTPFWWASAAPLPSFADRALPTRADFVVIGGGYTGLSAALCTLPNQARRSPFSSGNRKLWFTFDLYPHAGQLDGLHYAMGYAGHGVALATYLGQQLAYRLAGKTWHHPFEGMDFPTMQLYRGNSWFLPFAALYYRFLDWVR
jgi:glycine/D-amino acid oxidase-like deaminating enzyme